MGIADGVLGAISINISADIRDFLSGMNRATRSLKDFSRVTGNFVTLQMSTAFATLSAVATKTASEVEDAMQKMAVDTGATGAALKEFEETIRNSLSGSANTITQTADAIGALTNKLSIGGKDLENLGRQVATVARLTGSSATELGRNLGQVTNAFNLGNSGAFQALDTLNQLAMSVGINIGQVASEMSKSAGELAALGLSFNQSAALLGLMEKNGIEASSTLSGLNKAVLNITKRLDVDAATAFRAFIQSIKSAKDETTALQLASEIAGAKVASTLVEAIRNGKLEFDDLAATIKEGSGSIETMDNAVTTFSETLQQLINENLDDLKELGNTFLDFSKVALRGLTIANDVFQATVGGWKMILDGVMFSFHKVSSFLKSFSLNSLMSRGGPQEAIDHLTVSISGSEASAQASALSLGKSMDIAGEKAEKLFANLTTTANKATEVFAKEAPKALTQTGQKLDEVKTKVQELPSEMLAVGSSAQDTADQVTSAFEDSSEQIITTYAQMTRALQLEFNNIKTFGERTARDIQGAFDSGIRGIIRGTSTMSDIVSEIFLRMAENIMVQSLAPLTSAVSAGLGSFAGFSAGPGSNLGGNLFGGFFADGGRPPMGKVSIVGENGPELFVPDSAGTIVPNDKLKMSDSGNNSSSQPIIYYIGVEDKIRREIQAATPQIVSQSVAAVERGVKSGGSFSRTIRG